MKSFSAIILLTGFLWTQFYNSTVIGIYELNKTDFIEQFCENTDKPELKCNGKCHLSKQLVSTNNNVNTNQTPELLPLQELFIQTIDLSIPNVIINNKGFVAKASLYSLITTAKIDHPPKV